MGPRLSLLGLLAVMLMSAGKAAEVSGLGIGFLWYPRSEAAAARLTGELDYVDLILGREKLSVFERVKPPVRAVCIALSLEQNETRPFPGLRETIAMLRTARVDPSRVILGYNPERAPGTMPGELDDLVGSVNRARVLAEQFGCPLLVGPGLKEMQRREELYPELARRCDFWLIQSQRLQIDPATRAARTPEEYREGVARIVSMLRQGNTSIRIVVQLIASGSHKADRFSADELVAYLQAVSDLVQAVRIYGGSPELLNAVIDRLRPEK